MNTSTTNPFVALHERFATDKTVLSTPLDGSDRFPAAGHLWRREEIEALIFAHAARRPLLVRGEPGSGKSQIARAAAAHVGFGEPIVEVVHPRFEALDLLYRVDSVRRLADAQVQALDRTNVSYVEHGRLWEAFDATRRHAVPVLLIDEIDKADADIPNALLDVLGNRSFAVPPLGPEKIVRPEAGRTPLVIITTNEERELPAAFVRRCAVLNLNPPATEEDFKLWLLERGAAHRGLQIEAVARERAAEQVWADRERAHKEGQPRVGLAEYVDLLTALHELTQSLSGAQRATAQLSWLTRLSAYALVKSGELPQNRSPIAASADPAGRA